MIARPLSFILCFGIFILFQALVPNVMALKKSSKVNDYMLEDQRMAGYNDKVGFGPSYDAEPFQPDIKPEDLLTFIIDYANMIRRNDVNSMKTKTGKQGNIKVKKSDQTLPDPLCHCEYTIQTKDLGLNAFPRFVETRNCSGVQQNCRFPYICKENLYDLIILKRRESIEEYGSIDLPGEFQYRWIAEKRPISVGCICTKNYIAKVM